jgi:hypothetical protein
MGRKESNRSGVGLWSVAALACAMSPDGALAQGIGAQTSEQVATARSSAPVDLTGNWVSLITENWRFRMVTAPIGDLTNIPLTPEGMRVARAWDPEADVANGEECRAFGAPGVMRLPTRLRITWADEETLQIDTDFGQQTRMLHFGAAEPPAEPTWQGHSEAEWELVGQRMGAGPGGASAGNGIGGLRVVTTHLRPGYLRRNGVPYSSDAILTEYFDRHDDLGEEWILHTRIVEDPVYLNQRWVVTSHFKREPDEEKWNPQPCRVIPPPVIYSGSAQESRDPENPRPR